MNKVIAVIRREFVERVRTRSFVIATVLFPVFIIGMMFVPALLLTRTSGAKRIAVIDATRSDLGARVEAALAAATRGEGPDSKPMYDPVLVPAGDRLLEVQDSLIPFTGLSKRKAAESPVNYDGLLLVTEDAVLTGAITYLGANVGSPADMRLLERRVQPLVLSERLEREGVDPGVVMRAMGPVNMITKKVADGRLTGESGEASFFLAYAMSFILYFALLIYGIQVMNSIVEEKANRIVEILASSLTPFQMMLGKVLGVGSVGLLQIGIWAGTASALTTWRMEIAGFLGLPTEGLANIPIPTMPGDLLVVFLLFFVLGFLLFAAMYAAVGAMCSTVQDTQQVQFPVTMLVIGGLMSMFALLNDPNGSLAEILSLIPFFTPFVIPVRYSISPLGMETLALSVAVTVAGMLVITWIASRIYRVGVLSYGKRASMKDILQWVRAR